MVLLLATPGNPAPLRRDVSLRREPRSLASSRHKQFLISQTVPADSRCVRRIPGWFDAPPQGSFLLFFLCLSFLFSTDHALAAKKVAPVKNPPVAFYLKVENRVPGLVSVSTDNGLTWKAIGSVKKHATEISPKGFTAASWIGDMKVAATAVNAIHLKVDEDDKIERARLISIVPDLEGGITGSYYSSGSTIVTDIAPGTGCFGGMWSPFVGNGFSAKWVEGRGEEFLIAVAIPSQKIQSIIFENKFDGRVELRTLGGERRVIGRVLRPVLGVGRFGGTKYVGAGRIRANHPGVIDIATAAPGKIGGFQIIPAVHGMSPEMGNARTKTQWMIVGPPKFRDEEERGLEGEAPLFKGFLRPLFREESLLSRFLVDVRFQNEENFRPMPIVSLHSDLSRPLPEWADTALKDVSAVRMLFPVTFRH